MRFDWKRFCDERRIPYVTRGSNTAKGNISIHCPFCGPADESEHMGLLLDINNPVWGCWKGLKHRGGDPAYLVARLLGISYAQAQGVVKSQLNNPDDFDRLRLTPESTEPERPRVLVLPKAFREFEFANCSFAQVGFNDYLKDRLGWKWRIAIERFNLRWCVTGEQAWRVVIPVYHKGNLVTWTGRAIGSASIRYLSLGAEHEARNIKDCLFSHVRHLQVKRKVLVITEGPFDAIRFDSFASEYGVHIVCVFGVVLSNAQLELLTKVRGRYQRTVVLLDLKEIAAASIMADQISEVVGGQIQVGRIPAGVKDPGELTRFQVEGLARQFTEGLE